MDNLDAGKIAPALEYMVASFVTSGTAAAQYLLTLENVTPGRVIVPRRCILSPAVANTPAISAARTAQVATAGTVLTATRARASQAAPIGIVRGVTASDGGAATAILVGGAAPPPTAPIHFSRLYLPLNASGIVPVATLFDVDEAPALENGDVLSIWTGNMSGSIIISLWWRELP